MNIKKINAACEYATEQKKVPFLWCIHQEKDLLCSVLTRPLCVE